MALAKHKEQQPPPSSGEAVSKDEAIPEETEKAEQSQSAESAGEAEGVGEGEAMETAPQEVSFSGCVVKRLLSLFSRSLSHSLSAGQGPQSLCKRWLL